jgi:broad specificity phosphatase PhoE
MIGSSAMSSAERPGLSHVWLVRHGQSAGNVARDAAEAIAAEVIEIAASREMDVPLSALGEQQAQALGAWFRAQPVRPTMIVTSPYLRAQRTATVIAAALDRPDGPVVVRVDERLREKEMGSLDRLTHAGILTRFPREAELRAKLGKFYYRPPGGESWCDVLFRVRAVLDHLRLVCAEQRVLLVAHQVVVLCARCAIEDLDERAILDIDAQGDVVNCGVTSYVANERGALELTAYNVAAPLEDAATSVTAEPDRGGAPS